MKRTAFPCSSYFFLNYYSWSVLECVPFPSVFFLTLVTRIFNSIATEIVLNRRNRILFRALYKICQEMRSDLFSKNNLIFSLWFVLSSLSHVVLIFFTYLFCFFLLQSFFALLLLYLIAPCWYKSVCPVYQYHYEFWACLSRFLQFLPGLCR